MTITQVITPLPAAPNPLTDTPSVFSEKAAASVAAQQAMVPQINAWTTQANALETNVNAKEATASGAASTALGYRDTAQFAADKSLEYRNTAKTWADAAAASAATIGTTAAFSDANPVVKGSADPTKQLKFEVDGFTAATTRTVIIPNKNGTMAMLEDGGLVFLGEIVLSNPAASVDFLNIYSASYDRYLITGEDLRLVSGNGDIYLRHAIGGVIDSTNSYGNNVFGSNISGFSNTFHFMGTSSNLTDRGTYLEILIFDPLSSTSSYKRSSAMSLGAGGSGSFLHNSHYRATPVANSGFSLYSSTGVNLAAGAKIRVYGYRKA